MKRRSFFKSLGLALVMAQSCFFSRKLQFAAPPQPAAVEEGHWVPFWHQTDWPQGHPAHKEWAEIHRRAYLTTTYDWEHVTL